MSSKGRVYFKDHLSGHIEKKEDGTFLFSYINGSRSISLTVPNSKSEYLSEDLLPFFDGLIPEGWLLDLAQKNWKISRNDRMQLLLTTCQDCIGAAYVFDQSVSEVRKSISSQNIRATSRDDKLVPQFVSETCLCCMNPLADSDYLYHKKCAKNLFGFSYAPFIDVSMGEMEKLALLQINQHLTLTGVQKKLSLSTSASAGNSRLTVVGLDGRFILKPSSDGFPEMAANEHLSMKLAKSLGIPVAECGLVFLASGELAYLTKRFDRKENEKIQMEDFCQLSEKMTDKKYSGSSEALGKVIDKYSTSPADDKLTLFQIILFSFWIGNADMHLKNFSLWCEPGSELIRMSPGYDFLSTRLLIPVNEDNEELALPVNGRKSKLQWSDFVAFGNHLQIPSVVIERVKEKMLDSFFDAEELIQKSFLSEEKKEKFVDLLIERSKRLS